MHTRPSTTSSLASNSDMSCKNVIATDSSASFGHSLNQSIVQQFTNAGNCLRRALKISPIGLEILKKVNF